MPKKPIMFGKLHFDSRGDAYSYLSEVLHSYDLGDRVSKEHGELLGHVLLRHPDAASKIGSGVDSFSVRSSDFDSRCFWVNRTDGSSEDFSIKSCVYDARMPKKVD